MKQFRPGLTFGDFVVRREKAQRFKGTEVQRDYRRGWVVWLGTMLAMGLIAMFSVPAMADSPIKQKVIEQFEINFIHELVHNDHLLQIGRASCRERV